ncbi:hypothetical protein P7H62_03550 [Vagococcus carniphilus]|uniref:hypothetical protein n=1 Tax=Vagococcus carniphilus TaxID=218144 RepID=UPI00288E0681|nr:hypothetical protein [Vagococcus carniphilus]MDT2830245.1 hypothetical protein [Vagococcus carniphilus]MDT2838677.1 hypothetical protein [Vagococcus carniphilus]MDT2853515.1 hypothetical protein [Vagococcus carniphilus]
MSHSDKNEIKKLKTQHLVLDAMIRLNKEIEQANKTSNSKKKNDIQKKETKEVNPNIQLNLFDD